jgi:DNA-binding transcriptional LysR family regulator
MTLRQLRFFIEIASRGSITEAARRLFVSQPSLSAALRELETEAGIELLLRSPRGISLTDEGVEFLRYARQVVEQADLLEHRYAGGPAPRRLCSISTQHYAFAVEALVRLIRRGDAEEYEYTLRETRTHEIIEDVRTLRSEIGILYLDDFNRQVIEKFLSESRLEVHPLFSARPHVFLGAQHPLANRSELELEDLADSPYLSFEQGEYNSFHFSEEILSTARHKKSIRVSDRATLFNLLVGLDGFTVSTGILSPALNGDRIVAIPLRSEEQIHVVWIAPRQVRLSRQAEAYVSELRDVIRENGYEPEES